MNAAALAILLPAFGAVEAVSDGAYGLIRGRLFAAALPRPLSRQMAAPPAGSSFDAFSRALNRRQEAAERRILERRPSAREALAIETAVASDALADALVARYQLERFGRASGDYAGDLRNWDASFIASGAVFGGAYLYAAGLRADWSVGPVRVDLDTKPGSALRAAFENGEGRGLASLALSPRGSGFSVRVDAGLLAGRPLAERCGLGYTRKF